jgi:hypothetical protein
MMSSARCARRHDLTQGETLSDLPTPVASRLRRPSWRDPRLVVGLLLVLAATVAGSVAVAAADDRTAMYAARSPLVPGQRLTVERLVRVDVQLGGHGAAYLSAEKPLPEGAFVLREVRAGELVPASALGDEGQVAVQPLTLLVDSQSAAPLVVGSLVDVYVNVPAREGADRTFAGPELALERVSVSGLPRAAGRFGSTANQAVQVMAPRERVRELIGQVDLGARVTVVPVPGSALKGEQ